MIVQAGARPDSSVYVRMKAKAAEEVGIKFKHVSLPAEATVEEVVETVKKLNDDEQTSGILVQLPLGDHVNADGERKVTEAVSIEKDVDGCVILSLRSKTSIGIDFGADFTRITLATFRLVHRSLSFRPALLRLSSDFSNLLAYRLKDLRRLFSVVATS